MCERNSSSSGGFIFHTFLCVVKPKLDAALWAPPFHTATWNLFETDTAKVEPFLLALFCVSIGQSIGMSSRLPLHFRTQP